jgi:hypothetical protein
MTCSQTYADANDFAQHWCIEICEGEEAQLNKQLRQSAARINAALHASNQCDCTLADWAAEYLKELNILIAVSFFKCPCSGLRVTPEERVAYMELVSADLVAIRESKLTVCAGETGADYPAWGSIERGLTEYTIARIIENREAREG